MRYKVMEIPNIGYIVQDQEIKRETTYCTSIEKALLEIKGPQANLDNFSSETFYDERKAVTLYTFDCIDQFKKDYPDEFI